MSEYSSATEALGQSEAFLQFMEGLSVAARVDRPTLIVGERGTGKELAAGRLHYLSARWQGPFVALNCSALAPSLIESELFGHEAGAFTGASGRRKGRFEAAENGTLFLDEIATMPLTVQEKILRAVEYGEFERVGGSTPIRVDVRVIGATNADLPALADAGRFKRDLLDRLGFEVLTVPPLRYRHGDIELLARHFADRMAVEIERPEPPGFSAQALATMNSHPWPGNVRELKNVVERAVYRTEGNRIQNVVLDPFQSPWRPIPNEHTPPASRQTQGESSTKAGPVRRAALTPGAPGGTSPEPLLEAVRNLELQYLENALTLTRHNQRKAAILLGLTYHQFRGLYRKHKEALDAA
ncbi:phage shock protein operon transcriptional activator [Desulfovibrio ferrophilus]|uniref:Fis family sigma-54 specific transcriptional activator PspF n=1 Tax=Desulfovibrio ferrophilus TaxID=241368 RepID=A0A2Z6AU75_9BACT|nr:phage shock protein operon transcriptional activator [Desulfovibrio ferrophilus]BBD06784.1 Fis family sigma-54 specific transcriptional activator PspF [Desulfovibrio ferrophilus]